jgi:hypothetical protein
MSREDVQKLLGGYATGTLTPEEQQALFAAALDDQELFDALGREQSLRDLLRDPAAKAEVLAALDGGRVPWYRHGWWRPAAVALAMAGIAVMAVVVTRKSAPKPEAVTVAELKAPAQAPAPEPRQMEQVPPGPAAQGQPGASALRRAKALTAPAENQYQAAEALKAADALKKDMPAPPAPAAVPPPAREEQAIQATSGKQEAATQPPAAAPRFSSTAENTLAQQQAAPMMPQALQQGQQGQQMGQLGLRDVAAGGGAGGGYLGPNARLLFYGNPVAAEADTKQKSAKKPVANSLAATARIAMVPAFHLGVRWSILRTHANGETVEAPPGTVLDAGEQVKLKLVPNDRGYLKVWERSGSASPRLVASGAAAPLQPFEAAVPAGARELYVQFTRDSLAGLPSPETRGNLIQTADVEEKATYVVNRVSDGTPQQLVVPITLNYK